MSLLRDALHAAGGVPRLYRAALAAGTGPIGAARVIAISAAAASVAAQRGPGVQGRQNALRHFTWQALLTARLGMDVAQSIADAQEVGTPNLDDSRVDRHNNVVGQKYGAAHRDALRDGSIKDAVQRLTDVGLAKWETDELIWVKPD